MSEEQTFEQMLDASFKEFHSGEAVKGTVIQVQPDQITLDIGYKSDGVLTRNEYSNDNSVDLTTVASIGDEMEVKILKLEDSNGQVVLSYKRLAADRGNKRIEEAYNNHEVLTAKVTRAQPGGLIVSFEEVNIFVPASLVSDSYERDLNKYVGQDIDFVITEYNPRRRRYIGDRKQLLVAKREELQKELFDRIHPGDVVEGTVKNITDFGAFIDLGGADGLLHISEMSWGRIENPRRVFKVGDQVTVLIKEINGSKIALTMKFPDQNPWVNASEKYARGNIVTGKVARMTDFGAFIELEPGIDALLHVSQISQDHIDKPQDVLKTGDEVTAKIVDFNEEDHKISLSVKSLNDKQEEKAEDSEDEVSVDIEAAIAADQAEDAGAEDAGNADDATSDDNTDA
ncbi:MAG: 30S ribosomal protein S1 [Lachnospiraceae bacterium]|nr:30S ribosomal protein S1 [Lachnospiraceae bacterium]